jgi:hypothetical protein
MEAPTRDDGEPDLEHSKLVGVIVEYEKNCSRYEIR